MLTVLYTFSDLKYIYISLAMPGLSVRGQPCGALWREVTQKLGYVLTFQSIELIRFQCDMSMFLPSISM